MEAYIFQRGPDGAWVPYDTPGAFVYGTGPFSDPEGLIDDIWNMAAACELPIESINAEYDAPQFELTLRHTDALKACDDAFLFRQMARELLIRRGYLISFLPKPFPEKSGSGLHFNVSFKDDSGTNIFAKDAENPDLGPIMRGTIAGLLHHHRALTAIMAPIVNSYERLKPASLSGYWANWGRDHRGVTVRVSAEKGAAARIEHRLADCAASPYFALAALLQAANLGVERGHELAPPERMDGIENVSTKVHAPGNLAEALDALEGDMDLTQAIGAEIVANYVAIKREEVATLAGRPADDQLAYYLHYI